MVDYNSLANTFLSGSRGQPQTEYMDSYRLARQKTEQKTARIDRALGLGVEAARHQRQQNAFWQDRMIGYAQNAYQFGVQAQQNERRLQMSEEVHNLEMERQQAIQGQMIEDAKRDLEYKNLARENAIADIDARQAGRAAMARVLGAQMVDRQLEIPGAAKSAAGQIDKAMGGTFLSDTLSRMEGFEFQTTESDQEVAARLGVPVQAVEPMRAALKTAEPGALAQSLWEMQADYAKALREGGSLSLGLFQDMAQANGIDQWEWTRDWAALSVIADPEKRSEAAYEFIAKYNLRGAENGSASQARNLIGMGLSPEEANMAFDMRLPAEQRRALWEKGRAVRKQSGLFLNKVYNSLKMMEDRWMTTNELTFIGTPIFDNGEIKNAGSPMDMLGIPMTEAGITQWVGFRNEAGNAVGMMVRSDRYLSEKDKDRIVSAAKVAKNTGQGRSAFEGLMGTTGDIEEEGGANWHVVAATEWVVGQNGGAHDAAHWLLPGAQHYTQPFGDIFETVTGEEMKYSEADMLPVWGNHQAMAGMFGNQAANDFLIKGKDANLDPMDGESLDAAALREGQEIHSVQSVDQFLRSNNTFLDPNGNGLPNAFEGLPEFVAGEGQQSDRIAAYDMAAQTVIATGTMVLGVPGGNLDQVLDGFMAGDTPETLMLTAQDAIVGAAYLGVTGGFGHEHSTLQHAFSSPEVAMESRGLVVASGEQLRKAWTADQSAEHKAFAAHMWKNVTWPMLKVRHQSRMPLRSQYGDDQEDRYKADLELWEDAGGRLDFQRNRIPGWGEAEHITFTYDNLPDEAQPVVGDMVLAVGRGNIGQMDSTAAGTLSALTPEQKARGIVNWLIEMEPLIFLGQKMDEKKMKEITDRQPEFRRGQITALAQTPITMEQLDRPGAAFPVPVGDGFVEIPGSLVARFYRSMHEWGNSRSVSELSSLVGAELETIQGANAGDSTLSNMESSELVRIDAGLGWVADTFGGNSPGDHLASRMRLMVAPQAATGPTTSSYATDKKAWAGLNDNLFTLVSLLPPHLQQQYLHRKGRLREADAYLLLARHGLWEEAYAAVGEDTRHALKGFHRELVDRMADTQARNASQNLEPGSEQARLNMQRTFNRLMGVTTKANLDAQYGLFPGKEGWKFGMANPEKHFSDEVVKADRKAWKERYSDQGRTSWPNLHLMEEGGGKLVMPEMRAHERDAFVRALKYLADEKSLKSRGGRMATWVPTALMNGAIKVHQQNGLDNTWQEFFRNIKTPAGAQRVLRMLEIEK